MKYNSIAYALNFLFSNTDPLLSYSCQVGVYNLSHVEFEEAWIYSSIFYHFPIES